MKKLIAAATAAALTAFTAPAAQANDTVELMERFYEVADARPFDMDALTAFYADDFTDHNPNPALPKDAHPALVFQLLAAGSPDSTHEIEMIIPSGDDRAIVVWSFEGTNTDNLFGIPAQDPALPFAIAGIEIWESEDDKVTGFWHVEDIAGLMAQLSAK